MINNYNSNQNLKLPKPIKYRNSFVNLNLIMIIKLLYWNREIRFLNKIYKNKIIVSIRGF